MKQYAFHGGEEFPIYFSCILLYIKINEFWTFSYYLSSQIAFFCAEYIVLPYHMAIWFIISNKRI